MHHPTDRIAHTTDFGTMLNVSTNRWRTGLHVCGSIPHHDQLLVAKPVLYHLHHFSLAS